MTTRRFRAAAVQTLARLGDYDHNIGLATRYVDEAVRQGAELVVFPECMDTGYLFDSAEHARELAQTVTESPFTKALAALARKHRIHIASGITEWDPDRKKIFNTGVLFDRAGVLVCHYHKQFLATHDQNWFSFGERGCAVVDTDLGRIGLLICFDGRIPEIFRSMALQGAEVIVDMANFFAMDQADLWGPARAYENGVWLVAATKAGYERSIYYPGGSMIVDPKGRVVSRVPYDTHGIAVADVDPDTAADKAIYTADDKFTGRRPETYGVLALPYEQTAVRGIADQPLVPSKSVTKVAAIQMHRTRDDADAEAVFEMIEHAARLGVKVLALPEYAFSESWVPDLAEAENQAVQTPEILARLAHIAARHSCLIAAPVIEREGEKLFVATVLVGPEGERIGVYYKTHLTAEERRWACAGDIYPVFDTPFGRIGVMSGFDAVFPETARCLGIGAADIVLWPAALREPFERELLAVTRAEDNRVALVLANRTDCPYPGGSVTIPPTGFPMWDINIAAPRTHKLGAVMPRHVDLAVCRQKMMIPKVDMFANRLPETYAALVAA